MSAEVFFLALAVVGFFSLTAVADKWVDKWIAQRQARPKLA